MERPRLCQELYSAGATGCQHQSEPRQCDGDNAKRRIDADTRAQLFLARASVQCDDVWSMVGLVEIHPQALSGNEKRARTESAPAYLVCQTQGAIQCSKKSYSPWLVSVCWV